MMEKKLSASNAFKQPLLLVFAALLLLCTGHEGRSQQPMTLESVDSLTYQLYLRQDWKQLIKKGEEALSAGTDFYYLRMRMGIAGLELFQPTRAARHFRQAMKQKDGDQEAALLLAKSLQYQLKSVEAGSLFNKLDSAAQTQSAMTIGFKPVAAHFDAAYVFRTNNKGLDFAQLAGEEGVFGQEHFYHDNAFFDAGLHFQTAPQWLFYVGYQQIDIEAVDRFAWTDYTLESDSVVAGTAGNAYYYHINETQNLRDFSQQLRQQALYLQAQWGASDRWSLTAGLQLYKVNRDFTIPDVKSQTITDTAFYDPASGYLELFSTELPLTDFSKLSWSSADYSISLHGRYHLGRLTATAGLGKSSINDTSVVQLNLGYQLMPLGNLKLTHQGEWIMVSKENGNAMAFRASLGWRPFSKILLETEVLAGSLNNLGEQYGYIIYNNPESLDLKFEAGFSYLLTKNLQLQLRYRNYRAQRRYDYIAAEVEGLKSSYYPIQSNTIIGGIKWIF